MDSNSAKYRVSVAVKNNWFPGHTIKSFDIIVNKSKILVLKFLQEEAVKAGLRGEVIGYVLIERGTPVRKTSAKKAAVKK